MSEDRPPYGNKSYSLLSENNTVHEAAASYGHYPRIQLIRRGLPLDALNFFLEQSGLSRQELARILQISTRTMQRYSKDQMLPSDVSEKLLALNDLYEQGQEALGGGPSNVTQWLRQQYAAIGDVTPLSLLDTYQGLEEVSKILGRIEWGIAS